MSKSHEPEPLKLPIDLPELEFVRRFSGRLEPGVPRLILEAGSGTGRHERYLRRLGHIVVSLDSNINELHDAQNLAEATGTPGQSLQVLGDVSQLPFPTTFDISLMNEVTHLLPKPKTFESLAELRRVTRQGGLNVVSGYLVRPEDGNVPNAERYFHPDELHDIYAQNDWEIVSYSEKYLPTRKKPGSTSGVLISSRVELIAQRPWA